MGVTTSKSGKVKKADVTIAKNYLLEIELKELNLLVEQYLAFAETQALLQKPMYMNDWASKLHDILTINQKEIKTDAGRITKKIADELALKEYEKFDANRKQLETPEDIKHLEAQIKQIAPQQKTLTCIISPLPNTSSAALSFRPALH